MWQNILESASKWFEFNSGTSKNKEPCNLKHFDGSSNPPQIYNLQSSFIFAYLGAALQRNWTSCNLFSVFENKLLQLLIIVVLSFGIIKF